VEAFFTDYLNILQSLHRDFIATFEDLPAEALDWVPGVEMNSFNILVVHTTGTARFLISEGALGEPSNRDRAAEFQARGLSVDELKARFAAVETFVQGALERITLADLATVHTLPQRGGGTREVTAGWALLHVIDHTGLHLGHAQITRQLWQQRR
jgi:uncharacterized damage-inducible protein DinB